MRQHHPNLLIETQAAGTTPQVAVVRDMRTFAALRQEWDDLLERSGAGLFNAWEWIFPWRQRLGSGRSPYILTAREADGRLCGLMALGLEKIGHAPLRARRLGFMGDDFVGSDYLDLVAERGREEEIGRLFAAELRRRTDEWDMLELLDIDEASATPAIMAEVLDGRTIGRELERSVCPHERFLPGEQFDSFLRRTRRRDNYLRRRKWLQSQPGFRIEVISEPQELERPMAEFFHLHELRWRADGGSSGVNGPPNEAFHRQASCLLAERGKLRLYLMWLGGQVVASVYAMVHRDRFYYYQSGYNPVWRSRSVGLVLVGATFEDALAQGLREYDFLRGPEPYKADWVTQQRRTVGLRLFTPVGSGALYDCLGEGRRMLHGTIKRVLPSELVDYIRRSRHPRPARDLMRPAP